jgi:hypothetical protein
MMLSRLVASLALGGALLALTPELAHAADASADADCTDGSAACGLAPDAAQPASDAATGTNKNCTASGNPCTSTAECCEGAYCGAFSASSGTNVCGSDMPDVISTGSCSLGGGAGAGGLEFVVLLGVVVGVNATRKRRSRASDR